MCLLLAYIYIYNLSQRITNDNYMSVIVGEDLSLVDVMAMLDPG